MGRPFLEKFADVQWEVNEEHLQAWKDGKTGYPIIDAAMRACKARGETTRCFSLGAYTCRLVGEQSTNGDCFLFGQIFDVGLA